MQQTFNFLELDSPPFVNSHVSALLARHGVQRTSGCNVQAGEKNRVATYGLGEDPGNLSSLSRCLRTQEETVVWPELVTVVKSFDVTSN